MTPTTLAPGCNRLDLVVGGRQVENGDMVNLPELVAAVHCVCGPDLSRSGGWFHST